jgi:hypothetical protein
MKENSDRSSESIPVAEIAAEATNDGAPAQSIPEVIPPRARADAGKKDNGPQSLSPKAAGTRKRGCSG